MNRKHRYLAVVVGLACLAPLLAAPAAPAAQPAKDKGGLAQAAPRAELQALRRDLKDLALSEDDTKAIGRILDEKAGELARAAGEIKILQARLERIMLDPEPSLEEMRKLVRSSLDYEYSIRMIRLERSIALRKLLGDRRWALLERLQRAFDQARKAGFLDSSGGGEIALPLIELFGRL
jgi:hypothetical protein